MKEKIMSIQTATDDRYTAERNAAIRAEMTKRAEWDRERAAVRLAQFRSYSEETMDGILTSTGLDGCKIETEIKYSEAHGGYRIHVYRVPVGGPREHLWSGRA
jgi:hypothetical protein